MLRNMQINLRAHTQDHMCTCALRSFSTLGEAMCMTAAYGRACAALCSPPLGTESQTRMQRKHTFMSHSNRFSRLMLCEVLTGCICSALGQTHAILIHWSVKCIGFKSQLRAFAACWQLFRTHFLTNRAAPVNI